MTYVYLCLIPVLVSLVSAAFLGYACLVVGARADRRNIH
jgi:hypothetical protein